VSVITEKGDITTSYLLIQRAKITDSGNYSCLPSNANPKSVNVHVLKGNYILYCLISFLIFTIFKLLGDHPAAVQRSHILLSDTLNRLFLQIYIIYVVL